MNNFIYDHCSEPATQVVQLDPPWDAPALGKVREPRHYQPDAGLQHAVNAALTLRRPLLLTGEPGTGKTELASHLAWKLHWGEPLKFETKSDSQAKDLFYRYDALGHFRAVQVQVKQAEHGYTPQTLRTQDFIHLGPLGLAILLALPKSELQRLNLSFLLDKAIADYGLATYSAPRCCVVLIDEIDKAPRDFPNDILNEIDSLYFRIPELAGEVSQEKIQADPVYRPVVVISSNSEKHLPDAFLRRCVYYNIPFPDDSEAGQARLKNIIRAHASVLAEDSPLLADALRLFYALRSEQLHKPPSIAELLAWLHLLRKEFKAELAQTLPFAGMENPLSHNTEMVARVKKTLGCLIKVADDWNQELEGILENWQEN